MVRWGAKPISHRRGPLVRVRSSGKDPGLRGWGVLPGGEGKGRALRQRKSRGKSTEAGYTRVSGQQVVLYCSVFGGLGGMARRRLKREVMASHSLFPRISLKIKVRLAHCCTIREHRKLFLKRKYNP